MIGSEVSVVVPVKDGSDWLLESVMSAVIAFPEAEIIVVDDGGNDAAFRKLHAAFGGFSRIVAGAQQGPAAARNVGQAVATRDVVVFLDADDVLEKDGARTMVEALRASGGGAAIGGWCDTDHSLVPFRKADDAVPREDALTTLVRRPTVVSAAAAARPWPRWDESLCVWEVARWQHDLVSDGRSVVFIDDIVTSIRQHETPGRVSLSERHFDAEVVGRFWADERKRLGGRISRAAAAALESRVVDAIYSLLHAHREVEARALWNGVDRALIRENGTRQFTQPRWIAGSLGYTALRAHAFFGRLKRHP